MPQSNRHQDSTLVTIAVFGGIVLLSAAVMGVPLALLAASKISLNATVALLLGVPGVLWVLAHTVVPDRR